MNFLTKRKILRASFWTIIVILFAAPIEVFHLLLTFLHVLFEWIEASLDFIIDVVFDTSLHRTQIIVFYIIIAAIFYGLYRLWKKLPDFYHQQKESLLDFFSNETDSIWIYWQESIANKIKLLTAASGLIFLLFM